jgi:DNA-3-methyladenine glycosylase II
VSGFDIVPKGPFSLASARDFADGFPAGIGSHAAADGLLMTFPVESPGWTESAAIDVWQDADGTVHGDIHGTNDTSGAERQAARSLSLDHDGSGWPDLGRRDPVIGRLQERYGLIRPVCFFSAYEAATSFVIGQRISMRQGRIIKARVAEAAGDAIEVGGTTVRPFPRPQRLLELATIQGLSPVKIDRIHELARAALDGRLDTERLRALPDAEALAELQALPGIGPWTAQAVLFRGCGKADAVPVADEISRTAAAWAYERPEPPDDATWASLAEGWRPYRMWASVLLHMAWRRDGVAADGNAPSYRQGRRARPV